MNKDYVVSREEFLFLQETVRVLVSRQCMQEEKLDSLERKHENNLKDWSMVKELQGVDEE